MIFTSLCYWMLGENERFLDSLHLIIDLKKYFISVNKTTTNCAVRPYPISLAQRSSRDLKESKLRGQGEAVWKLEVGCIYWNWREKNFPFPFFFSCVISINFWLENRAKQVVSSAFQTTVSDISWRCDIFWLARKKYQRIFLIILIILNIHSIVCVDAR